jgi:putative ATP-dependent endonuclease of the OLD family
MEGIVSAMKLIQIKVDNFRLLKDVSIQMNKRQPTTILVGSNNSGKTSVAEVLQLFVSRTGGRFSINDFSVICRAEFDKAEKTILDNKTDKIPDLKLPFMQIELHFDYEDNDTDLAVAADLLMDLDPTLQRVVLRAKYAVKDAPNLATDFKQNRKNDQSLVDFLSKHINEYYHLLYFKVAPDGNEERRIEEREGRRILDRLIRVDFVFAQRHIDDQENSRSMRLSRLLYNHYEDHYRSAEPEGHEDIESSLNDHADILGNKYMRAFEGLEKDLRQFGYPRSAPSISIKAELNASTMLKDNTRIYYGTQAETSAADEVMPDKTMSYELPEKYNGLGFKNLIYMILQIQSFRITLDQMPSDRPRVHLIFIEEPETHLHPQIQSVFVKKISSFLSESGTGKDAHIILTTHSSHIVADSGFAPIRYFHRKRYSVEVKDLLQFESQQLDDEAIRFLLKYLSLMRCDLFFADKAILVEGQVERLLLPKMIAQYNNSKCPDFASEYITVMEVGGAHAHKFKNLLKFIEIPTLIITDLDSVGDDGKVCCVATGTTTSNPTLKSWLPGKARLDELKNIVEIDKLDGCICVAYQVSEDENLPCGRSFEEAFIYRNTQWLLDSQDSLEATGGKFKQDSIDVLVEEAYGLKLHKVNFALDLMIMDGWSIPKYIEDGLKWLAESGDKK